MIKSLAPIFLFMIIFTWILLYVAASFAEVSCYDKAYSFDDYKWSITSGCMVEIDGKFIPLRNVLISK